MPPKLRGSSYASGPTGKCDLCGRVKQLVLQAGRWVLQCAFCLGLMFNGDPELPTPLTIDPSLAQVNNIAMAVATGGIVVTPEPVRLTVTTYRPQSR